MAFKCWPCSPDSFALNHEINSRIQLHANLISESVCNDSVSACHGVGHAAAAAAAAQSAVLYVCVALQSLHKAEPKALAQPQQQLQNGSGNTEDMSLENSRGSSEEEQVRNWSLLWSLSCL